MTLKDLQVMEIPIFSPGQQMQATISMMSGSIKCRKKPGQQETWQYVLCREVAITPWLPLFATFRYPGIIHFDSATDLVLQLASRGCPELEAISSKMRRWNAAAVEDDASFWRDAITALDVWNKARKEGVPAAGTRIPAAPGLGFSSEAKIHGRYEPYPVGHHFGIGRRPWESPQMPDLAKLIEQDSLFAACGDAQIGSPLYCALQIQQLLEGPFGSNFSAAFGNTGSTCLTNFSVCSTQFLMYGTHLLQNSSALLDILS